MNVLEKLFGENPQEKFIKDILIAMHAFDNLYIMIKLAKKQRISTFWKVFPSGFSVEPLLGHNNFYELLQ